MTDRLYQEKVCHFAHHPHHTCARTATGEASADHLFMKQALHEWMTGRGLRGGVVWSEGQPAAGIDVTLSEGRRLRFRLGHGPDRPQAPADELVRPGQDRTDWIFGQGRTAPRELFDEQGYVFRIRFETRGASRCPYLGVQQPAGDTTWTPFSEAAFDDEGLNTAAVRNIQAARRSPDTAARTQAPSTARKDEETPGRRLEGDELVTALREALELHARWGTRPTWSRLQQTIGADLSDHSDAELRTVLAGVDHVFHHNDPVLSALIRTDAGEPLPYLHLVVEDLGLGRPSSKAHLKRWCQRETDRAFAKYGLPARTMPPALSLDAAVPEVLPLDIPRPARRRPPAAGRGANTGRRVTAERVAADRARLEHLTAQGRTLAKTTPGSPGKALRAELRLARRYLESTRRTLLDERGITLLGDTIARLEAAVTDARKPLRSQPDLAGTRKDARPATPAASPAPGPEEPSRSAEASASQPPVVPQTVRQLRQRLVAVAREGGTIGWPLLGSVRNTSDTERRRRLVEAERCTDDTDAPLLSSLVVAPGGGPVPYFRGILEDLGLAVPRSEEALLKIWAREQERCHAAHAVPPRAVPVRLVPRATDV
ncbi:hypothetical protein [Streptomyces sp. XY431]|uniref:hypothetical protein n=1 Tax=Streptomyces sp. XY431 TaxID=1415562 RepID=UPI00336BDFD1